MPPRIPLILAPTPHHRLHRVSEDLGIDLWIKRDDLTGFAIGGNKGRKLEYLLGDLVQRGIQTVVTCGSTESNFVRQLALACDMSGIECHAVLMEQPFEEGYRVAKWPRIGEGNRRLNRLSGLITHELADGTWDELFAAAGSLSAELIAQGKRVENIPIGGSCALGAYAFYEAATEVTGAEVVVHASSSGSTQVGLTMAYRGSGTRVIGISCDPEPALLDDFVSLSADLGQLIQRPGLVRSDLDLRYEFVGEGYGVPSPEGDHALRYLAQTEGIYLDPIYSAKAFAGLLDLSKNELAGKRVTFWHTGGLPALFAFP